MKDVSFLDDMLSGLAEEESPQTAAAVDSPFTLLNLDAIEPDAGQPRQHMDESALEEMADSILQHGVLQPITVMALGGGKYRLVSGERRWRAARLARDRDTPCARRDYDLQTIPALVVTVPENHQEILERQLIENLVREDMSIPDTAMALKRIMESTEESASAIARRIGKSAPWVRQVLAFADPDLEPRLVHLGVRVEEVPIALAQQILACSKESLDWMRDRIAKGAALDRNLMEQSKNALEPPAADRIAVAPVEPEPMESADTAEIAPAGDSPADESLSEDGSLDLAEEPEDIGAQEEEADVSQPSGDQMDSPSSNGPVDGAEDTSGQGAESPYPLAAKEEGNTAPTPEARSEPDLWLSITLQKHVWQRLLDAAGIEGTPDANTIRAAIEAL